MEGFLSLEQAADQLQFSVSELSRQIEEGRVVAIVKEGRSWLSAGEVSRLKRQSERAAQPAPPPQEELRLLRRSTAETTRPPASSQQKPPERPLLSFTPSDSVGKPVLPVSAPAHEAVLQFAPAQAEAEVNEVAEVVLDFSALEMPHEPVPGFLSDDSDLLPVLDFSPAEPIFAEAAPVVSPIAEAPADPAPPPSSAAVPALAQEPEARPAPPPSAAEPVSTPAEPVARHAPPVSPPSRPTVKPALQPLAPPPAASSPQADEKLAQQIRELNKRCAELENRNLELEATSNRLKSGLQETEATLKRNRSARSNLENDVIALQDQLTKAKTRNEALEREIQHLGAELERTEDAHNSEIRRMRSNKGDHHRSGEEREPPQPQGGQPSVEYEVLRNQMSEKDRLLAQEYEQRATLRSQLEDKQQKYFELKARYDKEKSEWSELLAQALQNQGHLRQQLEEMKAKNPKGWNPFRREK